MAVGVVEIDEAGECMEEQRMDHASSEMAQAQKPQQHLSVCMFFG